MYVFGKEMGCVWSTSTYLILFVDFISYICDKMMMMINTSQNYV